MNMTEYNIKYRELKKEDYPTEGFCPLIKQGHEINDSCKECQNFYVVDRKEWTKRVVEAIEKGESPWYIELNCDKGFQWLMHQLYESEKRRLTKLFRGAMKLREMRTKQGYEIIRQHKQKRRKVKEGKLV